MNEAVPAPWAVRVRRGAWFVIAWYFILLSEVVGLLAIAPEWVGAHAALALGLPLAGALVLLSLRRNRAVATLEVPLGLEAVERMLMASLHEVATHPSAQRFVIRKTASMLGLGETVTVSAEATSPQASLVRIESRSDFALTALDFGKNKRHTSEVRARIVAALGQTLALEQASLVGERSRHRATELTLQRLQAQSEAHFLFNTLAHVRALVTLDAPRSVEMIDALTAYLRTTSHVLASTSSTIGAEVDLVAGYLQVMAIRLGARLRIHLAVDAPVRSLPSLAGLLLPLVENAIKHGIEPAPDGGEIRVTGSLEGPVVKLEVADTGLGFRQASGSGTGLNNLKERLAEWYGGSASLSLAVNQPSGVVVTLCLPVSR